MTSNNLFSSVLYTYLFGENSEWCRRSSLYIISLYYKYSVTAVVSVKCESNFRQIDNAFESTTCSR